MKTEETLARKPFYRRDRFHHFFMTGICVIAALICGALVRKARQQKDADDDLAGQRRCMKAFVASDEFAAFVRSTDEQVASALAAAIARPADAGRLLPSVAAWERSHAANPAVAGLTPPASTSDHAAVFRSARAAAELLARRGLLIDDASRTEARAYFVRRLLPFARSFQSRSPEYSFAAVSRERSLQDIALAAYAPEEAGGTGIVEAEGVLFLSARFGGLVATAQSASTAANP